MADLITHTNNVAGLLGYLPNCQISTEDAANAFLRARKYYWQQLGTSSMDLKVRSIALPVAQVRDFNLNSLNLKEVFPAFVELEIKGTTNPVRRVPVDIVPLEDVPSHEGSRALAIYGSPLQIRLAWDAWSEGALYFYYDPTAEIANLTLASEIEFPFSFLEMVEYKAALDLCPRAEMAEARDSYNDERPINGAFIQALQSLKQMLAENIARWENEFRIYRLTSMEERSYERRSDIEIPNSRMRGVI